MSKRNLQFSFEGSEINVIRTLTERQSQMEDRLVKKMTSLMEKLRDKLQRRFSNLPYSTTKRLSNSVEDPQISLEGGIIVGRIEWGKTAVTDEGFNYAMAVEEGAVPHVIYPLKEEGTKGFIDQKGHWKTSHGAKQFTRFGGNKVAFFSKNAGKNVVLNYASHPGVARGRHIVQTTTLAMEEEIIEGIREVLYLK